MKKSLLFIILILLACGQIPETQYFTLNSKNVANQNPKTTNDAILYISRFDAAPIYEQDKLIHKISEYEIQFDYYRRWIYPPSELMTFLTCEYLSSTGYFNQVTLELPRTPLHYRLEATVTHFDYVYKAEKKYGCVGVDFKLFNAQNNEKFWTENIYIEQPVAGEGMKPFLDAMNTAVNKTLNQLQSKLDDLPAI